MIKIPHPAKLYLFVPYTLPSVLPHWRQMPLLDKLNLMLMQLMLCIGLISMVTGPGIQVISSVSFYYLLALTSLAFPVMFLNPDQERLGYRFSKHIIDGALVLHCYLMMVAISILALLPLLGLMGLDMGKIAPIFSVLFIGMAAMTSMQYAESYSDKIGTWTVITFTVMAMLSLIGLLMLAASRL